MARKKMSETGQWKAKKADFSFEKIQEKHKKYGNEMKNFSVSHGKSSRFFRRRKEKCRKEREKSRKIIYRIIPKKV